MTLQDAATPITSSDKRHHEADTQLYGRWLVLARVVWVVLVVFILGIFSVLLPVYLTQLQTVCTSDLCASLQPTPDTALCRESCQYFALCGGGAPSNKLCENNAFDSTCSSFAIASCSSWWPLRLCIVPLALSTSKPHDDLQISTQVTRPHRPQR